MTKKQLIQAAFQTFGEAGYNGGSLAQIAEMIGIKKQSIYTYFTSKDALYLAIYDEALQFELSYAKQYFSEAEGAMEHVLYQFLTQAEARFRQFVETKFFIRCSFLTPQHLQQALTKQTYFYLDTLQQIFEHYFHAQSLSVPARDAAIAFLALLDSLHAEMLYGGQQRFEIRLTASWNIFYRGIRSE